MGWGGGKEIAREEEEWTGKGGDLFLLLFHGVKCIIYGRVGGREGDVQGEFLGLCKCLGVDCRSSVKEAS